MKTNRNIFMAAILLLVSSFATTVLVNLLELGNSALFIICAINGVFISNIYHKAQNGGEKDEQ